MKELNRVVIAIAKNEKGISLKSLSRETEVGRDKLKAIVEDKEFFIMLPDTNRYVINRFHKNYKSDSDVADKILLKLARKKDRIKASVFIIILSVFIVLISR
ncbi:hypothetical protein [uncultured Shewanella sp.]|uniref:hypothetical protein n=1 Tax=uncultured Shewanella sp. TaxID=173975 RepID=UPI00260B08A7|nr:hypothetical protein [uncultured Shewanella sp.]